MTLLALPHFAHARWLALGIGRRRMAGLVARPCRAKFSCNDKAFGGEFGLVPRAFRCGLGRASSQWYYGRSTPFEPVLTPPLLTL